jgi:NADPH:quinone reductase-like Zn-dependent oxidoreductase
MAGQKVGDRVAYTQPLGAYRTQRVVVAERLVKLPDAIAFDVAHVGQRVALRDAAAAHRDLESRRTIGATVLLP